MWHGLVNNYFFQLNGYFKGQSVTMITKTKRKNNLLTTSYTDNNNDVTLVLVY